MSFEIEQFMNFINSRVHVISGPKGCGKTEFCKALTYVLKEIEEFNIIFLITYDFESNQTHIIISTKDILKKLKNF